MFFPFTFSIPTPFTNPFDAPQSPERADGDTYSYASPRPRRLGVPPRRPIPDSPPPSALSRKRGRWSPDAKARASSSLDITSTASAYIDSPIKYIDFGDSSDQPQAEPRAPKRRRIAELADSVISTAFSAAVIGTAVGLTAYRLWRDRGKDGLPNPEPTDNFPPPPPYSERPEAMSGPSYVPTGMTKPASTAAATATPAPLTPRRPRPNTRRQQASTRKRRPVTTFVRTQSPAESFRRSTTYHTASSRSTPGPSGSSQAHTQDAASGDELDDEDMQLSGQMDWMSAQLQALINDGKRALGTEVVVGGADEFDDGAEGWDDDEAEATPSRAQSRATTRNGRPTSRASRPRPSRAWSGSASSSVKRGEEDLGFEVLYQSPLPSASSKPAFTEDDGTSEELRVAMDRVRKAYGLR